MPATKIQTAALATLCVATVTGEATDAIERAFYTNYPASYDAANDVDRQPELN